MPVEYVPLVTVLVSAIVGGLIALLGVFLTNRSNSNQLEAKIQHESDIRHEDLLRDRGEELYELVDKWIQSYFSHYFLVDLVMQGKINYSESREMEVKKLNDVKMNFGRIEMIISVYFPSIHSFYEETISCREKTNKIEIAFQREYDKGNTDGTSYLGAYIKSQKEFELAGDNLKNVIIECINTLG